VPVQSHNVTTKLNVRTYVALRLVQNLNPAQRIMHARKVPLQEPVLPGVLESNYSAV